MGKTNKQRKQEALALKGLVRASFARSTKTFVLVFESSAQGLDDDLGGMPYSTVCDEHGGVCGHANKTVALQWASAPQLWCPTCMDLAESQ